VLTHEQFMRAVAEVPCAGGQRHGVILHALVRWLRPKVVVEVGSFMGHSACWLARALQENAAGLPTEEPGELYCIDDWSLSMGMDTRFLLGVHLGRCQVNDRVTLLDGKSDKVGWPYPIDLAFIDGDHSFDGCKGDVERAMEGGAECIVVHDVADWWGPRRWLAEFERSAEYRTLSVGFDGGLAVAMRCPVLPEERFTQREYPAGQVAEAVRG